MICGACGAENRAGSRFCDNCGAGLAATCPSCGEPNRADARFCASCGHNLAADAALVRTESAAPIAEAERRLVTVLFADLVGFTTVRRGPRRRGGPRAAERATSTPRREIVERTAAPSRSSSAMRSWPSGARRSRTRTTPSAPSGRRSSWSTRSRPLRPGPPGARRRPDRRGGGDARRDEPGHGRRRPRQHRRPAPGRGARRGRCSSARRRMRAAERRSSSSRPATQSLKGKTGAGAGLAGAARGRAERGGQGRADALEAPFVGRDEELRLLKDLLHAAGRERRVRARVDHRAGRHRQEPAGVGVREVHRRPRRGRLLAPRPVAVLRRGHHVLGARRDGPPPRRPGRGRRRGDDPRRGSRRPWPSTSPTRANASWIEPALLALLGVERGARRRPRRAVRRVAHASSSGSPSAAPTVLVFEDLQWADTGLLDFIDHLLEWSRGLPILVVTLARPELLERRPDWGAGRRTSPRSPSSR